jgi:hypothetical protein
MIDRLATVVVSKTKKLLSRPDSQTQASEQQTKRLATHKPGFGNRQKQLFGFATK